MRRAWTAPMNQSFGQLLRRAQDSLQPLDATRETPRRTHPGTLGNQSHTDEFRRATVLRRGPGDIIAACTLKYLARRGITANRGTPSRLRLRPPTRGKRCGQQPRLATHGNFAWAKSEEEGC
jgi:hypothetical protein